MRRPAAPREAVQFPFSQAAAGQGRMPIAGIDRLPTRTSESWRMRLLNKLQNPWALVAQGFVLGGLIFFATHADSIRAASAPADAPASLLPSENGTR